eukprot:720811_1
MSSDLADHGQDDRKVDDNIVIPEIPLFGSLKAYPMKATRAAHGAEHDPPNLSGTPRRSREHSRSDNIAGLRLGTSIEYSDLEDRNRKLERLHNRTLRIRRSSSSDAEARHRQMDRARSSITPTEIDLMPDLQCSIKHVHKLCQA